MLLILTAKRAGPDWMNKHSRFWEIDLFRTIAIVMMITFHCLYVADYLGVARTIDYVYHGFWWWFPRVTGGIFIFLAGLSVTISYARSGRVSPFLRRALMIFAWGLAITGITWLIARDNYVRFGILHFFGIAFLLAPLFLKFRYANLAAGAILMAVGIALWEGMEQGVFPGSRCLFWLIPHSFATLDYWPLLPWLGLFLVGMFCGKTLYPDGNRRFRVPELTNPIALALILPGRYPLLIYLAQWPIIIGIFFALYPDRIISYLPF